MCYYYFSVFAFHLNSYCIILLSHHYFCMHIFIASSVNVLLVLYIVISYVIYWRLQWRCAAARPAVLRLQHCRSNNFNQLGRRRVIINNNNNNGRWQGGVRKEEIQQWGTITLMRTVKNTHNIKLREKRPIQVIKLSAEAANSSQNWPVRGRKYCPSNKGWNILVLGLLIGRQSNTENIIWAAQNV